MFLGAKSFSKLPINYRSSEFEQPQLAVPVDASLPPFLHELELEFDFAELSAVLSVCLVGRPFQWNANSCFFVVQTAQWLYNYPPEIELLYTHFFRIFVLLFLTGFLNM